MAVALSPKGKPARSTCSRCCVLPGDSVLWDLDFLLVVKAEPTDNGPASALSETPPLEPGLLLWCQKEMLPLIEAGSAASLSLKQGAHPRWVKGPAVGLHLSALKT